MLLPGNLMQLLLYLTQLTKKFNLKSAYYLFFSYYVIVKLEALIKTQLKLYCIPDEIFNFLIMKHIKCGESDVDHNLYVLCNSKTLKKSKNWFYMFCKTSKRKYKVVVIFTNDVPENNIYVSESMKYNVNNRLNSDNAENVPYFLSKFQ